MRPRALLTNLRAEPFQPFRVRLSDDTTIDVPGPSPPSSARAARSCRPKRSGIAPAITSRWRTVALSHMVEFFDIDD